MPPLIYTRKPEYQQKADEQFEAARLIRELAETQEGFIKTTLKGAAWEVERTAHIWQGLADKEEE